MRFVRKAFRLFFLMLFLCNIPVHAEKFFETEMSAISENQSVAEAKKEIFQEVVKAVSIERIVALIGAEVYEKNKELIEQKVIQNSSKYVVFFKTGSLTPAENGFEQKVFLKISLVSLQTMLLELGILYNQEARPVVAHFLKINDRSSSKSYLWWAEDSAITKQKWSENDKLGRYARKVEEVFSEELKKSGAYLLPSISKQQIGFLPSIMRKKVLSEKEMAAMAFILKANALLIGEVNITGERSLVGDTQLTVFVTMKNLSNGRTIADLSRKFAGKNIENQQVDSTTEEGDSHSEEDDIEDEKVFLEMVGEVAGDLKVQVQKAWQKGIFGSQLYRLVLKGPLSYKDTLAFKSSLSSNVRLVKAVRERLFEPDQVHFEVDVTGKLDELVEYISRQEKQGIRFKFEEVSEGRVFFRVEKVKLVYDHVE